MTAFERLDQLVEASYPEMEADLLRLLEYPSVRGEAEADAPYGKEIADCLDYCLKRGAELGFAPTNGDGHFGLLDWLAQDLPPERQVGVLSHLDVVPAVAAEWQYAPFAPAIDAGKIFGRGAIDDKGPFIAALYATIALRAYCAEAGLTPQKGVRHFLGCAEESGMDCLAHFKANYPQPSCGFSPDSAFPGTIGEKGIIHIEYQQQFAAASASGSLLLCQLSGGTGSNVVPSAAEARLTATTAGYKEARQVWQALPPEDQARIQLERHEPDQLTVSALGQAAHASMPEEGDNAICAMLRFLSRLPLAETPAAAFVQSAAALLATDSDGTGLGIRAHDAVSILTAVLAIMEVDEQGGKLLLDIRYPVTHEEATYRARLEAVAEQQQWQISQWDCHLPMYIAEDQTPARELLAVYREKTGDQSPPLVIGGGTYARMLKHFMAYGPDFRDEPFCAHKADEYIRRDTLLIASQIYARALYRLCVADE